MFSYSVIDVRLILPTDYTSYKTFDRSYGALNLFVNNNCSSDQAIFDLRPYLNHIQLLNSSMGRYFYIYDNSKFVILLNLLLNI